MRPWRAGRRNGRAWCWRSTSARANCARPVSYTHLDVYKRQPYINAHRDCTFVVMLPGEGVAHPNFANIVHDLVLLHSLGVRLVLVHGSRPQIEARLAARGLTPHFHRDLRITDAPTLECVIDAVGQLRIAIEARLSMDMAASPMQGSRCLLYTSRCV